MTKEKKQSEEPKVEELSNEELEQAKGGVSSYMVYKIADVDGASELSNGIKYGDITLKRG